ncbi:hypothetical protein AYL99_10766 [Fonsecaea erecta]|uniref:CFEM domain-containing protein n=1 Tax=Fonsecaea erecta TaxID=1367422 RepID=A0A178Z6H3_9EURO|nr:hypothetical protein AYL99_10766 [Fonsecaea erecta]OAP55066.1 hypothetical protein AYL99_10766 [Fonsecaea erecta]
MLRQLCSILTASTLLVGIVSAQQAPTLPSCATSCPSVEQIGICNTSSFLDGIACCVFKACDPADQTAALDYAHSICDPVGASSLLPASATCTSTSSSSATSSAAGSGSGSGSGSTTTTINSSVASSASVAASSASASISSALSSASESAKSAASSASASLSSATGSVSQVASSTSASASPTGAGNQLAIGLGAVGAGMLGLAAVL